MGCFRPVRPTFRHWARRSPMDAAVYGMVIGVKPRRCALTTCSSSTYARTTRSTRQGSTRWVGLVPATPFPGRSRGGLHQRRCHGNHSCSGQAPWSAVGGPGGTIPPLGPRHASHWCTSLGEGRAHRTHDLSASSLGVISGTDVHPQGTPGSVAPDGCDGH